MIGPADVYNPLNASPGQCSHSIGIYAVTCGGRGVVVLEAQVWVDTGRWIKAREGDGIFGATKIVIFAALICPVPPSPHPSNLLPLQPPPPQLWLTSARGCCKAAVRQPFAAVAQLCKTACYILQQPLRTFHYRNICSRSALVGLDHKRFFYPAFLPIMGWQKTKYKAENIIRYN